ncbi:Glycosyl transferase [Colletotrichum higginsianum IMI 349063]|uniref:Glycosyl transferase n=1 Tax=Colletotrichum higginsianum (strain IMI 349063) TaxID=759273 RepID=A0A1B7XQX1_COLHI|nr:Glycosyl transferase [Colletotrichum higginsianum IMI 349063]OBR02124.1 Glycosyl transferase [Colletotrichum higginsianum IMI 349063]
MINPSDPPQQPLVAMGSTTPNLLPIPSAYTRFIDHTTWGDVDEVFTGQSEPKKLGSYIAYAIAQWEHDGLVSRDLWRHFVRDFHRWTDDVFHAAGNVMKESLRDTLRERGVYVAKNQENIATNFFACLEHQEYHEWSLDEVEEVAKDASKFKIAIQDDDFLGDITGTNSIFTKVPQPRADRRDTMTRVRDHRQEAVDHAKHMEEMLEDTTDRLRRQRLVSTARDIPPASIKKHTYVDSRPRRSARFTVNDVDDDEYILSADEDVHDGHFDRNATRRRRDSPRPSLPAMTATRNDDEDRLQSRQFGDLARILNTDKMKYGGDMYDVFDMKVAVFFDACSKVDIKPQHYALAFSLMLRGKAADFYYRRICKPGIKDFTTMMNMVRDHFETPQMKQSYISEWHDTTFPHISEKNPDKSKAEILEILIERLEVIQTALPDSMQNDEAMKMQLLNACAGIEECNLYLYNPAPTLEGVCSQLRSSIAIAMHVVPHRQYTSEGNDQHVTDRQYRGSGRDNRFGRRGHSQGNSSSGNSRDRGPPTDKKCYVCHKHGCYSTCHTAEEQSEAYAKFKSNKYVKDSSKNTYMSFLASYEGCDYNNSSDEDIRHYCQIRRRVGPR